LLDALYTVQAQTKPGGALATALPAMVVRVTPQRWPLEHIVDVGYANRNRYTCVCVGR